MPTIDGKPDIKTDAILHLTRQKVIALYTATLILWYRTEMRSTCKVWNVQMDGIYMYIYVYHIYWPFHVTRVF